ncbi:unnamed protein product, partial [Protopolystoma xenopodis]
MNVPVKPIDSWSKGIRHRLLVEPTFESLQQTLSLEREPKRGGMSRGRCRRRRQGQLEPVNIHFRRNERRREAWRLSPGPDDSRLPPARVLCDADTVRLCAGSGPIGLKAASPGRLGRIEALRANGLSVGLCVDELLARQAEVQARMRQLQTSLEALEAGDSGVVSASELWPADVDVNVDVDVDVEVGAEGEGRRENAVDLVRRLQSRADAVFSRADGLYGRLARCLARWSEVEAGREAVLGLVERAAGRLAELQQAWRREGMPGSSVGVCVGAVQVARVIETQAGCVREAEAVLDELGGLEGQTEGPGAGCCGRLVGQLAAAVRALEAELGAPGRARPVERMMGQAACRLAEVRAEAGDWLARERRLADRLEQLRVELEAADNWLEACRRLADASALSTAWTDQLDGQAREAAGLEAEAGAEGSPSLQTAARLAWLVTRLETEGEAHRGRLVKAVEQAVVGLSWPAARG